MLKTLDCQDGENEGHQSPFVKSITYLSLFWWKKGIDIDVQKGGFQNGVESPWGESATGSALSQFFLFIVLVWNMSIVKKSQQ